MTVAEYPNALLDETTAGEVIVAELEMWTQPTAAFIRSSSGFEGTTEQWIGRYLLDDGNFGLIGFWEKLDEAGKVIDVSKGEL